MELKLTGEVAARLAGLNLDTLKGKLTDQASGQLLENAEEIFSGLIAEKISKISREQHSRGLREKGVSFETALKPLLEGYNVTLETGETAERAIEKLQEAIVKNNKAGTGKTDPAKLTKEDLQKLPIFKEVLEESQSEVVKNWQKKHSELEQAYQKFQSETNERQLLTVAKELAFKHLKSKNAVGSDNENFMNAVEIYLRGLGLQNLKPSEDGKSVIVMNGTEAAKDELGNPITFDKHIEKNWGFGFNAAPAGGSPPRANNPAGGNTGVTPINQSQFDAIMNNPASTSQQRIEAQRGLAEYMRQNKQ